MCVSPDTLLPASGRIAQKCTTPPVPLMERERGKILTVQEKGIPYLATRYGWGQINRGGQVREFKVQTDQRSGLSLVSNCMNGEKSDIRLDPVLLVQEWRCDEV